MSHFSADWLDLRESVDAQSRAATFGPILAGAPRLGVEPHQTIQVVDLGAGTGANLRYLAPLLGGSQEWLTAEVDPTLLDGMDARMRAWADSTGGQIVRNDEGFIVSADRFDCRIRTLPMDLATELDQLAVPEGALVSASALLDLVSRDWLWSLARRAAGARASVSFALSYNGRIEYHPAEPEDSAVRELFNAHQRTDKGFGPAMGPDAADMASAIFSELGYAIRSEPSDWRLGPDQGSLQRALLDGWVEAAQEIDPMRASTFDQWRERRRVHIDDGRSEMIVGHTDMIGFLTFGGR